MENFDLTSALAPLGQLVTLLTDPSSNLIAALMLYGIIAAAVLIVLLVAIMWLMSMPEDETEEAGLAHQDEWDELDSLPVTVRAPESELPPVPQRPRTALTLATGLLAFAVVVMVVWVTAGYTTASTSVCDSCHTDTPHTDADKKQPHAKTACVGCHEPGGPAGRYFFQVPSRVAHFIDGWTPATLKGSYGAVSESACASCHTRDIATVTVNAETGIKMSHAEPLDASATCTDCHMLADGVVGSHNAGMNPCLRCHDSKIASAKCETCHDKDTSAAARARSTSFQAVQVPEVRCGGCHDQKKECDTCHGTRLPHSRAFMAGAHARAGAVSFWYEGGRTCARCHTAARRPCTKCHTTLLGRGHTSGMAAEHRQASSSACDSCHRRFAQTGSRDFCRDVCHSPAAIAESPR